MNINNVTRHTRNLYPHERASTRASIKEKPNTRERVVAL